MKRHAIRLTGSRANGARLSAAAMRDLLDALIASARHAVRLRMASSSVAVETFDWMQRVRIVLSPCSARFLPISAQ